MDHGAEFRVFREEAVGKSSEVPHFLGAASPVQILEGLNPGYIFLLDLC